MNIHAYTSANSFPMKLLLEQVVDRQYRIMPVHVQLNPTNNCNLNCSFCSCKGVNRKDVLNPDQLHKLMRDMKACGTKSITVTGGGEPFTYDYWTSFIGLSLAYNFKYGVVTNGTRAREITSGCSWIRVSLSDESPYFRKNDLFGFLRDGIKANRERGIKPDYSFSYVISGREIQFENIAKMVLFANENDFSHVRIVSDILSDIDYSGGMFAIQKHLEEKDIDQSLVIYQNRSIWEKGTKNCYISLLKPVISADGKIYPCCGAQYAIKGEEGNLPDVMCMGGIEDFTKIFENNIPFNGSVCDKCYYTDYNKALDVLLNGINHKEFV